MDLEKFDKIPEIFQNSKKSLEKVLETKLTFHEKPGVPETWQISMFLWMILKKELNSLKNWKICLKFLQKFINKRGRLFFFLLFFKKNFN